MASSANRRVYSRDLFTSLRSKAAPLSKEVIRRLGAAAATWKSKKRPSRHTQPPPPPVQAQPVFEPPKGLVPVDESWLKPHPLHGDLTGSLEGGIEDTPVTESSVPPVSHGPPSPPPGFGPPAANTLPIPISIPIPTPVSIPIPAASPPQNIAAITKSRIARGPDLSRNFASRIEFTNSNGNGNGTAVPAPPPTSSLSTSISNMPMPVPPTAVPVPPSDNIHRLFQSDNLISPATDSAPPFSTLQHDALDSNHPSQSQVPSPSNSFNSKNSTALLEQWFQDISVAEKKLSNNPVVPPPSPPLSVKKKEPEQLSSNVLSFFNSVKAQATKKKSPPAANSNININSNAAAPISKSQDQKKKSSPSSPLPNPTPSSRVQLPIRQQQHPHTIPEIQNQHHHLPRQRVQQEPKIDHGLAVFPHLGSSQPKRPTPAQSHPMLQQFHRILGQPSDLNTDPRRIGLQRSGAPPARFNVPNGNHIQQGNPANQQQQHLFNLFAKASNSSQQPEHLKNVNGNSAPQLQAAGHMSQNAHAPLNATMFAPPPQAIYLQQLQANAARHPSPQQQQQQQRHQFTAHMMHPTPPGTNNMPQGQPVRIVAHPKFIQAGGAANANIVPSGMMNKPGRPQQHIPVPAVDGIASATVAAQAAPPHNPENVDSLQQWFHKLQQHQHHAPST